MVDSDFPINEGSEDGQVVCVEWWSVGKRLVVTVGSPKNDSRIAEERFLQSKGSGFIMIQRSFLRFERQTGMVCKTWEY